MLWRRESYFFGYNLIGDLFKISVKTDIEVPWSEYDIMESFDFLFIADDGDVYVHFFYSGGDIVDNVLWEILLCCKVGK